MGDKADGGLFAGQPGVNVAMLCVIVGLNTHVAKFIIENPGKVVLLLSGWPGSRCVVRLCVDLHVAHQALDQ